MQLYAPWSHRVLQALSSHLSLRRKPLRTSTRARKRSRRGLAYDSDCASEATFHSDLRKAKSLSRKMTTAHRQSQAKNILQKKKRTLQKQDKIPSTSAAITHFQPPDLQEPLGVCAPDTEQVDSILRNAHANMHCPVDVCAVCAEDVHRCNTTPYLSKAPIPSIRSYDWRKLPPKFYTCLQPVVGFREGRVPSNRLWAQYDVSQYFPPEMRWYFGLLLLHARGLVLSTSAGGTYSPNIDDDDVPDFDPERTKINICRTCYSSLKDDHSPGGPKFKIGNGWFIGQMPSHLQSATRADWKACTSSRRLGNTGYYKVFYSNLPGQHRLKGHCTSARVDLSAQLAQLPLHPSDIPIRCLFTGAYTRTEKLRCLRDETLSRENVLAICRWLREHNSLYSQFDLSEENLMANPNIASIPNSGVPPEFVDHVSDHRRSEPRHKIRPHLNSTEHAQQNVPDLQYTIRLSDPESIQDRGMERANNNQPGTWVLRCTTHLEDYSDPTWLARSFPNCFPFGRGGLHELRDIPCSKKMAFLDLKKYLFSSPCNNLYASLFLLHCFLGWSLAHPKQCAIVSSPSSYSWTSALASSILLDTFNFDLRG